MGDIDFALIGQRFDEMARNNATMLEKITELAVHQKDMNSDVTSLIAEIGGAPDWRTRGTRETIRARMHKLENDNAATELAKHALIAASEQRKQNHINLWTTRRNTTLLVVAVAGALEEILRITHVLH